MRKLSIQELNRLSVDEFKKAKKIPLIILLENIRSLSNIGSVFRTADAFAVEKIYLCGITAQPPHKEIHKTALGATESVEWEYRKDINEVLLELKKTDYTLCAIEQAENSILLNKMPIDKTKKYAIILGNEVEGVEQTTIDQCDNCIEIPQFGTKHSLNVSVCNGIITWHFFNSLK